jgi:hypothetical protein
MTKFKSSMGATFEAFDERVTENSKKYPTRKKAYQKTEAEHKQEFGKRRFTCYQSYKSTKYYHHYKNNKNA